MRYRLLIEREIRKKLDYRCKLNSETVEGRIESFIQDAIFFITEELIMTMRLRRYFLPDPIA